MPSKFKATVITQEYANALTDSVSTGKPIVINRAVASSTIYTEEQLSKLNASSAKGASTDLVSDLDSAYRTDADPSQLLIRVSLSNVTVTGDFKLNTLLIYGTYNGKSILVSATPSELPELIPAYDAKSPVSLLINVYLKLTAQANAPINVVTTGFATTQAVADLQNYVDGDFNDRLVHKTGDETVSGTKSFANPINGSFATRPLPSGLKLADVATQMVKYSGYWVIDGSNVPTDVPDELNDGWLVLSVQPGTNGNTGSVRLFSYAKNMEYVAGVNNKALEGWKLMPSDASVVHNTGNEYADGTKTFAKQVVGQQGFKGDLTGNVTGNVKGNVTGTADNAKNADVANALRNPIMINGQSVSTRSNNNLTANPTVNQIDAATDLNDLKTPGYYVARNAQPKNAPSTNTHYFDLQVYVNGNNGYQWLIDDGNNMYMRLYQNGNWHNWTMLNVDDTTLVHKSSGETISGSKTFGSQIIANGGIKGNLAGTADNAKSADVASSLRDSIRVNGQTISTGTNNLLTADPTIHNLDAGNDLNNVKTPGYYVSRNVATTNSPSSSKYYDLVVYLYQMNGLQVLTDDGGSMYTRLYQGAVWKTWKKMVNDDATVVHVAGNETISGDKIFTGTPNIRGALPTVKMDAQGGAGSQPVMQMFPVSGYGSNLALGAGGNTIVGGGDSAPSYAGFLDAQNLPGNLNMPAKDSENSIVVADEAVHFVAGFQNPSAAHEMLLKGDGSLSVDGNVSAKGFNGPLQGNVTGTASNANEAKHTLEADHAKNSDQATKADSAVSPFYQTFAKGTDWNNLQDAAYYRVDNPGDTNTPWVAFDNVSNYGFLTVESSGGMVVQSYRDVTGTVCIRSFSGSPAKWNAWSILQQPTTTVSLADSSAVLGNMIGTKTDDRSNYCSCRRLDIGPLRLFVLNWHFKCPDTFANNTPFVQFPAGFLKGLNQTPISDGTGLVFSVDVDRDQLCLSFGQNGQVTFGQAVLSN